MAYLEDPDINKMKILSHRSKKELDATTETYTEAMQYFPGEERGYIANRAAHHFIIIEEDEGIVSIIYFDDENPTQNYGEFLFRRVDSQKVDLYYLEGEYLQKRIDFVKEREKNLS